MTINLTPRKCLGYRSPVEPSCQSLAGTSKSGSLDALRFAVESTVAEAIGVQVADISVTAACTSTAA